MPRAHKLFKDRQAVSALPATLLCFLAGLNNKKNETKKKELRSEEEKNKSYIRGFVRTTFYCLWRPGGWPYCLPVEPRRSSVSKANPLLLDGNRSTMADKN